jgi:hypothetical protein
MEKFFPIISIITIIILIYQTTQNSCEPPIDIQRLYGEWFLVAEIDNHSPHDRITTIKFEPHDEKNIIKVTEKKKLSKNVEFINHGNALWIEDNEFYIFYPFGYSNRPMNILMEGKIIDGPDYICLAEDMNGKNLSIMINQNIDDKLPPSLRNRIFNIFNILRDSISLSCDIQLVY